MTVVYEDNHIIIVNKTASEIVQGDKTGDVPLSETVKQYLKEKYHKPGNVFIGVTHRLDRPVSGLVVFAKTSKALSRLNEMFKNSEVKKTYWAIVKQTPAETEGELVNYLVRNEKQNKSYAYDTEAEQELRLRHREARQQEGHPALSAHRPFGQLQPAGGGPEDGPPPSDPLSVGQDGLPHQGRPEVWLSPLQSRRQYLPACPPRALRPSCFEGTDRCGGSRSVGQSVAQPHKFFVKPVF